MIENPLSPPENHHKNREIGIYISLIIAIGIMVLIMLIWALIPELYPGLVIGGGPLVFLAMGVALFSSVLGFFTCSWLLRRHLLLWYGCLFTLFLIMESMVPGELQNYILLLGVVILLVLPVIWVRNAYRS